MDNIIKAIEAYKKLINVAYDEQLNKLKGDIKSSYNDDQKREMIIAKMSQLPELLNDLNAGITQHREAIIQKYNLNAADDKMLKNEAIKVYKKFIDGFRGVVNPL